MWLSVAGGRWQVAGRRYNVSHFTSPAMWVYASRVSLVASRSARVVALLITLAILIPLLWFLLAPGDDGTLAAWFEGRLGPDGHTEELTCPEALVGLVKRNDFIATPQIVEHAGDISREAARPEDRHGITHHRSP